MKLRYSVVIDTNSWFDAVHTAGKFPHINYLGRIMTTGQPWMALARRTGAEEDGKKKKQRLWGGLIADLLGAGGDSLHQFVDAAFFAGFPLEHRDGQIALVTALGEAGKARFKKAMARAKLARLARDMSDGPKRTRTILNSYSSDKRRRSFETMFRGRWGNPETALGSASVQTGAAPLAAALTCVAVELGTPPLQAGRRPRVQPIQETPWQVLLPLAAASDTRWMRLVVHFAVQGLRHHLSLEARVEVQDRSIEIEIPAGIHASFRTIPLAKTIFANRRALLAARTSLQSLLERPYNDQADEQLEEAWELVPWLRTAEPPLEFTDQNIDDLFAVRPASGWNEDPFFWAAAP